MLRVVEALGVDGVATREIWRFLFEVDWTDEILAWLLPVDHPLVHLVARPDYLDLNASTGLWCGPSTSARRSRRAASGRTGASRSSSRTRSRPGNAGTWTLADGVAKRSSRRPDRRLDVRALGAAYLGGFSFALLARAGQVEEASRGGLDRADALFGSDRAPWCPEIF